VNFANLAFVLVAVGASIVGSLYLWLRTRKPQTFMSSIETFQREMGALARDPDEEPKRRRGKPTRLRPIVPPKGGPVGLADKIRAARLGPLAVADDDVPEGLRPIVPATGQQGLADKLRTAQRMRQSDGSRDHHDDGRYATGGNLKEH
jgi:hypothetical protein